MKPLLIPNPRPAVAAHIGHPGWLDQPPQQTDQPVPEPPSPREPGSGSPLAQPHTVPPIALRDTYGSTTHGVEDLTLLVARVLDVAFVFRDSYDHGEHYDYHGPGGEKIEIKENADDDDGLLMEPAHPQYRSFVYVTRSPRAHAIAQAMAGIGDVEHVRCEIV